MRLALLNVSVMKSGAFAVPGRNTQGRSLTVFRVRANGQLMNVKVPPGIRGGQTLQIRVPGAAAPAATGPSPAELERRKQQEERQAREEQVMMNVRVPAGLGPGATFRYDHCMRRQ